MPLKDELLETVVGIPPDGWSLGHVTINGRSEDDRMPIEAMRRGAFAVHEVNRIDGRGWRVSHAPSGLQIWTFSTFSEAIELAERIESMTDWGQIKKQLPSGTNLFPKVRAIINEIADRPIAAQ
jgi:hypothetical protein